ncbi:hypothetical protein TNCV_218961 [Trichonephila clavipes]|uniref:Uncharacterized protein n=1 Tax=Trichonephila clavipes TaxID=2585209 RepID=A0A8X6VFI5_TRICX|nr:hypothetical protein TNCV_218961 [Trichonephila clavipes]
MGVPLPALPQASRPGTPQDLATTSPICQNLRRISMDIKCYSIAIEGTHALINDMMSQGMTDPNHPTLVENANFLERMNVLSQQACTFKIDLVAIEASNGPRLRYRIITCFAQTSDSLARLTQTLARMPDVMDMRERNMK